MEFIDAAPGQQLQQARQVDLALRVGQHDHFGAGCAQGRDLPRIFRRRGHQRIAAFQQARPRQRFQMAVHHHAQRLAGGFHIAHVQARVVVAHRACAGEDGTGAGAPGMAVTARLASGDPLTLAVVQCRLAVQAGGHFQAHPGPAARHARNEADVQLTRLRLHQAVLEEDARRAQSFHAIAAHLGIGIAHRRHHARHARFDQRVGARRRAAVVAAGFERDIDGGAACLRSGRAQRVGLGMRLAGADMPAFADDGAVPDDDTADAGIGRGGEQAPACQLQRMGHEFMIGGRKHRRPLSTETQKTQRRSHDFLCASVSLW